MRLSDLERIGQNKTEAQRNKEQGTREISLNKDEVVDFLSRGNDLAQRKIDELPEKVKDELRPFFNEKFWGKMEVARE